MLTTTISLMARSRVLKAFTILFLIAALFSSNISASGAAVHNLLAVPLKPGSLPPPTNLTAVELLNNKAVKLTWGFVEGAVKYNIYRSLNQSAFSAGNLLATVAVTSRYMELAYTDVNFDPGLKTYYYVMTSVDSQDVESSYSNEVAAMPHYTIVWAGTVFAFSPSKTTFTPSDGPATSFNYTLGDPTLAEHITGEVYIPDRTGGTLNEPDILAQFGYSPVSGIENEVVDLTQWTHWINAPYYGQGIYASPDSGLSANSRYLVNFAPEQVGNFYFTFRFTTNEGRSWVYTNLNIPLTDPKNVPGSSLGFMSVSPNPDDTVAPDAPTLSVDNFNETTISLSWTASPSPDIYAYDVYRSDSAATLGERVNSTHILAGQPLVFTDVNLTAGTHYFYRVVAMDASINQSQSNIVDQETLSGPVAFSLILDVPPSTPLSDLTARNIFINRVINPTNFILQPGIDWMGTRADTCDAVALECTFNLSIQQNTVFNFNFSRGSQATIQTQVDGNTPSIDPSFTITAGLVSVNRVVANWDDPLVETYSPQSGNISPHTQVWITWNQDMPPTTTFHVFDIGGDGQATPVEVTGSIEFDAAARKVTFTPDAPLNGRWHYRVEVKDQMDAGQPGVIQQSPMMWEFVTGDFQRFLPVISN